jgi:hypothetical protein
MHVASERARHRLELPRRHKLWRTPDVAQDALAADRCTPACRCLLTLGPHSSFRRCRDPASGAASPTCAALAARLVAQQHARPARAAGAPVDAGQLQRLVRATPRPAPPPRPSTDPARGSPCAGLLPRRDRRRRRARAGPGDPPPSFSNQSARCSLSRWWSRAVDREAAAGSSARSGAASAPCCQRRSARGRTPRAPRGLRRGGADTQIAAAGSAAARWAGEGAAGGAARQRARRERQAGGGARRRAAALKSRPPGRPRAR